MCDVRADFVSSMKMSKFWYAQGDWSNETFGANSGPVGALKHLAKEVEETLAEPFDLEEYADMMHLIFDACRRAGFSFDQLASACHAKLEKNKTRTWGDVVPGEPCEHIEQ